MKKIMITGGAGFIGSAMTRFLIKETQAQILVVDKLTYAGNLESLKAVEANPRYAFRQLDICDFQAVKDLFHSFKPTAVLHFAAESHVDRSIDGPSEFLQTNIIGTFNLLENFYRYWKEQGQPEDFRFHHVSTDEVFGALGPAGLFREDTAYDPSSPYSATKAASDHLVRAWHRTYGIPVLVTNCSNNYGPYHYPEKLIPLMILNALKGKSLPVYGDGKQVRDWLFVDDHVAAIYAVLTKGVVGETYNIGGDAERENIHVVHSLCSILDELKPDPAGSYSRLISFVPDRPGHDRRYAIDTSKIKKQLGWNQTVSFEVGLRKTVEWFLENQSWVDAVLKNKYDGNRLGVLK